MKYLSMLTLLAGCVVSGSVHAADETFDSGGVKIRYVTEGTGEAVVLIHGWMADSSMWGRDLFGNTQLKPLDGFELIAMDCRGHGKSDKPHDRAAYGVAMADDVVRLLDHLKIQKAHLVGYSSGTYIAGKVAATHPDRVLSLVYADQAPIIVTPELASAKSEEVEAFATAVDEGKDLGTYIMAVMPNPKPSEAVASGLAKWMFAGKDVKALAFAGRSFKELAVTEDELRKCSAPVLFIRGGDESSNVKDNVAWVHKLLGRGDEKVIEGGDHITTLGKPEFATALVTFLRSNKSE